MRINLQREIYDLTQGKAGGSLKVVVHPALCEHLRQKLNLVEKNINRTIKVMPDPQIAWEDYKIILE